MVFILDYHLCDEAEVGSCEGRSDFPLPGGFWRKVFSHIFEYSMTKSNITSDIRIFYDQFEDSIASPPPTLNRRFSRQFKDLVTILVLHAVTKTKISHHQFEGFIANLNEMTMYSDQFSLLFQFSRLSNQQRVDQSSFVKRALPSKETLSTKIMMIFLL